MRFDNLRRKFRDMHVRYGFEEKTSRNLIADLRLTLSRAGRQLLNVMEEGLIEPPEDPGNWLRFALDKESDCLFKSHKHTLVEAQPGMPVGQLLAEDTELKKKTKSQKDDDADAENTQKDDGAKTDKLPMLRTGKFSDLVGWWHTLQPLRSRFGDAGEDLRDREAFIQRHVFIEAVTEWLPRQFSDRFSPIPDLERWNAVTLDGERASFISDWIPICYSDPPGWVDTRKYYKDIDIVGFALPLAEYSAEACALFDEWIAPTSSSVDGAEDPEEAPHSIVPPGSAQQSTEAADLPRSRDDEGGESRNVFRRGDKAWQVRFQGGDPVALPHRKGMSYIAKLLMDPGSPMSAAKLKTVVDGRPEAAVVTASQHQIPVIDRESRESLNRQARELEKEIDEARKHNDHGRLIAAQKELSQLADHAKSVSNIRGRPRSLNSTADSEKHRKSVSKAIRDAIEAIREVHPELACHLTDCIQFGSSLTYRPDTATGPWDVATQSDSSVQVREANNGQSEWPPTPSS